MQIQLTQDEIKEAVRLYVTDSLGINLAGKTLTTTFTATRGEAGIVATLVLQKAGDADAVEIPGFTNAPDEVVAAANTTSAAPAVAAVVTEAKPATKPAAVAAVITEQVKASPEKGTPAPVTAATLAPAADTATTAAAVDKTEPVEAAAAEDVQVADSPAEAAAVVVEAAPKTTTSLFG